MQKWCALGRRECGAMYAVSVKTKFSFFHFTWPHNTPPCVLSLLMTTKFEGEFLMVIVIQLLLSSSYVPYSVLYDRVLENSVMN